METEQQHKSLSLAVKLGEREREKKLTLIFKLCLEDPRSILSVCQPNTAEDCRKLFRVVKYRSYLAASFFPDLRQCSRMPSRSFARPLKSQLCRNLSRLKCVFSPFFLSINGDSKIFDQYVQLFLNRIIFQFNPPPSTYTPQSSQHLVRTCPVNLAWPKQH